MADDQELWVQRTSGSTVVVRRGLRIVLSLVGDDEAERIGRELIAVSELSDSETGETHA